MLTSYIVNTSAVVSNLWNIFATEMLQKLEGI
jgi:hypothetical protein